MSKGSRLNLVASAARILQAAYARRRVSERARYEQLQAAGAFVAPFAPGLQAELGLPEPLRLDPAMSEAA